MSAHKSLPLKNYGFITAGFVTLYENILYNSEHFSFEFVSQLDYAFCFQARIIPM